MANGACTEAAVREALQQQAVFGGRLGTNLLELEAVTEEALAFGLEARHGLPALFGELVPDPHALGLLDRKLADRWDVVPFIVAERRLALLARDPRDPRMLDEVAFATGRSLHPFAVPESRLWRLLTRWYGVRREERGLAGAHRAPRSPPAAPPVDLAAGDPGDLIDEAEFERLYGRLVRADGGRGAGAAAAAPPIGEPAGAGGEGPGEEGPPPLTPAVLEALTRAPAHAPPIQLPPAPARPDEPEPSPLGFDEAVRFLEGIEERGAIARTVLRYARSRFRRAALFTVRGATATGWAGLGGALHGDAVRQLRIPLDAPGVLGTVVRTRAHFLGPIPRTEANVRLLAGLGGGVPRSALAVPILALGRVVNVFWADGGGGALVDPAAVGELLILAARISRGYEALARRAV